MLKNTKRMKLVHLYIFGIGNVGKTLIEQVLESHTFFKEKHEIDLRIVGLANSTHTILKESGVDEDWQNEFKSKANPCFELLVFESVWLNLFYFR